jgi:hypothetical protein
MKLKNQLICVLLFGFVLIASGCTSQSAEIKDSANAGAKETPNTDVVYTQSPSELVLNTTDLPEGWTVDSTNLNAHDGAVGGESANSNFIKVVGSSALVLSCQVNKYSSVIDAKSEYQTMYNSAIKSTSVGHPIFGQEAYSKIDPSGQIESTIFRKGNIIAEVTCMGAHTFDYAIIMDGKITH